METTPLVILMTFALVALISALGTFILRVFIKSDEQLTMSDMIIREVRHDSKKMELTIENGVKRETMMCSIMIIVLTFCGLALTFTSCN